jgi:hypothetical protein
MGLDGNWQSAIDLIELPALTRAALRQFELHLEPESEPMRPDYAGFKAEIDSNWLGCTVLQTPERTILALGVHPLWSVHDLREPCEFADVIARARQLRDANGQPVAVRFIDWFNLAARPHWVEQYLRSSDDLGG